VAFCNVVRAIKSKGMKWAGVMERMRNPYKIPVGNLQGRDNMEDPFVDG
jgi:hypothetical protein